MGSLFGGGSNEVQQIAEGGFPDWLQQYMQDAVANVIMPSLYSGQQGFETPYSGIEGLQFLTGDPLKGTQGFSQPYKPPKPATTPQSNVTNNTPPTTQPVQPTPTQPGIPITPGLPGTVIFPSQGQTKVQAFNPVLRGWM